MSYKDSNFIIAGIDFGAKKSGNTSICFQKENLLHFNQSEKGTDADRFIEDFLTDHEINLLGIDAPLSLPEAYFREGNDYFYRKTDRDLKAMSPMFLGALTARAIQLVDRLNCKVIEVYPGARIRQNRHFNEIYKKDLNLSSLKLQHFLYPEIFQALPQNWHQFDAAVAWWITNDYIHSKTKVTGNLSEGLIYY